MQFFNVINGNSNQLRTLKNHIKTLIDVSKFTIQLPILEIGKPLSFRSDISVICSSITIIPIRFTITAGSSARRYIHFTKVVFSQFIFIVVKSKYVTTINFDCVLDFVAYYLIINRCVANFA